MNNRSNILEEKDEIIRILGELKHVSHYDYSQAMHQSSIYLDNYTRIKETLEDIEEFSVDRFLEIDTSKKADYYRFQKPAGLSVADIVYRLFIEIPATYGVMTSDGPVTFGNELTVSIANFIEDKATYVNAYNIDDKTYIKILLDYENIPIHLLNIGDIDCMRLDWIGWMEEAIIKDQLQFVLISDLALINRPQIDRKFSQLAKQTNANIIGFANG